MILLATPWTNDISPDHTDLLNGLGQVLAGALATFLGVSVQQRHERQQESEVEHDLRRGDDSEERREDD